MTLKKPVLIAAFALATLPLLAGARETTAKEPAKGAENAIFAVPGLSDESVAKSLIAALAKETGVTAAKTDAEAGTLTVTFEPDKASPETLTKAVTRVAPGAKFAKVVAAEPGAGTHDCSKCPSKSACGKEAK